MAKTIIESDEPISEFELKNELEKIKEQDKELNFRANRTLEYLHEVSKISFEDGNKLKKALIDLNIPRMKDVVICKIVDLLPKTEDELKSIIQVYSITISKNNMKEILKTVSEYI
ncbi:MAG: DNA-directed polymerase subunit [Candidatus Woesearchaeota archaeon]|nr:DNA-directed polymerase subunit [Candidatus Woesearchaeota archaeon]